MKKLLFIMAIPIMVNAAPSSELVASLRPWQPLSITLENGNLTIVLPERRMTSDIYLSVISTGVCASLWLRSKESLDGVYNVTVLNEYAFKGYVFEGGKDLCFEYGEIKDDPKDIFLLGNTHLY